MLKIWELKRAADEDREANRARVSAAQLRVQADIEALELPPTMQIEYPDPSTMMQFVLTYTPDAGIYKDGRFVFDFKVNSQYPIEPPKVRLRPKIWHPNIDLEGALCLNILREDWKPVLSLNHVAMGIQFLFLEPNKNDPLNREAAASLHANPDNFMLEVRRAMQGGIVNGIKFDNVLF